MTDQELATEFIRAKIGDSSAIAILYFKSYNMTTKTDLGLGFKVGHKYIIKVIGGMVVEWYMSNVEIDGVAYRWVSLDIVTGEVVDHYFEEGATLTKTDPNGNIQITNYIGMPLSAELPHEVNDFPYDVSMIFAWANRPYGLILEYFV